MGAMIAPSSNSPGESLVVMAMKVGRCLGAGGLLFLVAIQAVAQDVEPTTFWKRIEEKSLYQRLWEQSRLYEDENNPVIQAFSIVGRYNGQYWSVNADQGNANGW
jgi:hypothetical protein